MSFSAMGRSSFAFGSVVMMRSLSISDASWLRNMALRWLEVRPSLRFTIPCLIDYPFPARTLRLIACVVTAAGGRTSHPEGEAEAAEDVLDLVERLATEVFGRKQDRK